LIRLDYTVTPGVNSSQFGRIGQVERFQPFAHRSFFGLQPEFMEHNMQANWIVAANASRARFFSQEHSSDALEEINDMVNDAARLRMTETESDNFGPTSAGKSVHNTGGATPNKTYEPAQTPDVHQAELFARDIAGFLLQSYQEGRFQQLSLVVSPQFLGMLRKLLDPKLESAVKLEINKDYTRFSPAQLLEQVKAHSA
jgi:protein required for attachment to host cells